MGPLLATAHRPGGPIRLAPRSRPAPELSEPPEYTVATGQGSVSAAKHAVAADPDLVSLARRAARDRPQSGSPGAHAGRARLRSGFRERYSRSRPDLAWPCSTPHAVQTGALLHHCASKAVTTVGFGAPRSDSGAVVRLPNKALNLTGAWMRLALLTRPCWGRLIAATVV